MLTLKAPIQLHIAQGLTGNAEAFSERIRGNYNLLGARFAAKDLLFLLTAPPDLPEDLGGMTTLVSQQTQVDARSVTLDVVNNVVNRILLDGTSQFTYQDQVYITSVLNRLGITNVEQFMAQIRQLRTENENTFHLTQLYRTELEHVLQQKTAGKAPSTLPLLMEGEGEEKTQIQDPRVSMSLQILRRLETANLYETMHAFQRNWSVAENYFHRNELRLAEQLRFSNAVSLAELRQQFFQQPQVQLLHHMNQFEAGTILEVPRDEEAVLSQAAVAALVTAVDNTVTEVLNRPQLRQEQWLRLENALWQTAENTLSRFETYHSHHYPPPSAMAIERERLYHREAFQLEEAYLRERQIIERPAPVTRNVDAGEIKQLDSSRPAIPPPVPAAPPMELTPREAEVLSPEILVDEITRIDQRNRTVLQAVQQELLQRNAAPMPPTPDVRRTMQDALRALEAPEQILQEIYAEREAALTVHPVLSSQEEALLRQADPAARALYERVLLYQKDPEAALAQGLVRPANLGAFNAELQRAMEQTPVMLEHADAVRETERLQEQTETVLEQFRQMPGQYRQAEMPKRAPEAMKIVHKQLPPDVTEELLERLEQQHTQRTVKTESSEEITKHNIHRTDMTQVERQVVTQTTEDIAELVNRTLARQMRTISDQVYRQMEKRLQMERSRRGRL